jgi:D-tyrosyl-tRNA(Tyr) deacylase
LATIDEEMISQCIERSADKVEMAILDWKGMKGDERKTVVRILEKKGLDIRKTNSFD